MPETTNCNTLSPLARIGALEARLARNVAEVEAAQKVRFNVFHQEMGANCGSDLSAQHRDADLYDEFCDHLIVLDGQNIVGTYRLMLNSHANSGAGFYSQTEFDLAPLFTSNSNLNFMELGRSCILPAYRGKRTMEALWAGTWAYAVQNEVDVMFGCVSFPSTNPVEHAEAFNWLYQNARLDQAEDCSGVGDNGFEITGIGKPANSRAVLGKLPPLLKGYLRLGARVGTTAVIDRHFGTTDLLVVLKVASINPRYIAHYGADASRFAARENHI